MTYINDLQAIDSSFTTIKDKESVDSIEAIIDVMKRTYNKNNEMYSKMSEVSNEVDNYQQKIEIESHYNISIMEITSKLKVRYDDEEEEKGKNDQEIFNLKSEYFFYLNFFFSLEIAYEKNFKEVDKCRKLGIDEYNKWLEKSASQNVYVPLPKEEIMYEDLPLGKYLGFFEAMVKGLIKFKDEKEEREKLEEIKRQKEMEQKKSMKSTKSRSRRRRKRYVESTGSVSKNSLSKSKVSKMSQSKSKVSTSKSRVNFKGISKTSLRSKRNKKRLSNVKYQRKLRNIQGKTSKKTSKSMIQGSQTLGQLETENTLPSIFEHRRFQKVNFF